MTKTYANDSPRLDGRLRGLDGLDILRNSGRRCVWVVLGLAEPGTDLLLFFLGVGREQLAGAVAALEEVRNEDCVYVLLVAGGQDISALDCLIGEAKDIVDDDDALGSIRGTCHVLRRHAC